MFGGKMRDMMRQDHEAAKRFNSFDAYARSIGCEVVMDEITCHTEEQWRKLGQWWSTQARTS
jgi:hypothetical protein